MAAAPQAPPYGPKATRLTTPLPWTQPKIETDPHHPTHIRTVRGIGYIFDREALGWAS